MSETHIAKLGQSGEIDLLELFRLVSRTWKHVFVGFILVSAFYTGWLCLKFLVDNPNTSVHKAIKLTFVGADRGVYPNGAAFQLEDILAPVILQSVFESHNLSTLDISVEEFRRSLNIAPYAPTYALIVDKYKRLLNNVDLTVPELEAIEGRMASELAAATSGAVLLTMNLDDINLPADRVAKILADLPATWAQYSIVNKGVLDLDVQLASAKSIDRELINSVDYMVISDLLQEKTGLVQTNIELLSNFSGAATLQDPITGIRLADLKQSLGDLRRYVIDDLMSPIRSLGLTRNRELSLYYYEDKKQRLMEDVQLLQRKAALVKEAFEKYSSLNTSVAVASPQKDGVAYLGGGAQLSANALDKVLEMSSDGKAEEYRQMLNQQWLSLNMRATEVQNQIDEVDRLIGALNGEGQSETSRALRNEYLARAEQTLPKILDKISDYLESTQRIYKQLSRETVGVNGKLYEPITSQPFIKGFPIDVKRSLIVWIVLIVLMMIIVIPAVMIRNAMETKRMIGVES